MRPPSQLTQIAGSILVALAIAAVAIAVVTAHFGPTPAEHEDHGGDRHGPQRGPQRPRLR
jgi:hypothetical protein